MKRLLLLLILSTVPLLAQPGPVSVRPDCFQFFTFTATGNSAVFDNRQAGCPYWTIVYTSNGFSVVSLVLQVAPDAGGTPGTWATYTATTGSNPNTATTQANSLFNGPYFPWLRVQLTTATGTGSVSGIFYGWRTPAIIINGGGAGSGCVGTAGTPCVVDGPTAAGAPATNPPVMIAGQDDSTNVQIISTNSGGGVRSSGLNSPDRGDAVNFTGVPTPELLVGGLASRGAYTTLPYAFTGGNVWNRQFACTNQVFVNLAASGNTQVIAASGSTNIRICHVHLSTTAPETIQLTTGTGVNCVSGNAVIDAYQNTSTLAMDFQPTAPLLGGASNALCINPSAATTLTGVIVYAQF